MKIVIAFLLILVGLFIAFSPVNRCARECRLKRKDYIYCIAKWDQQSLCTCFGKAQSADEPKALNKGEKK